MLANNSHVDSLSISLNIINLAYTVTAFPLSVRMRSLSSKAFPWLCLSNLIDRRRALITLPLILKEIK